MTIPLPDFTHFTYILVSPPVDPKGKGWDKLKECERRLAWYRWAERLDEAITPTRHLPLRRHQVILDDCLSAFLMTFEAALQFVREKLTPQLKPLTPLGQSPFNYWLRGLPEHDLQMRGFTAHVKRKPAWVGVDAVLGKTEEDPSIITAQKWLLPELTPDDLKKVHAVLSDGDLPAWNALVRSYDAAVILEHGLRQAQAILLKAESLL
jgi:hypothetical protein